MDNREYESNYGIIGNFEIDSKKLANLEIKYDLIRNGSEKLSNLELLSFLDEIIDFTNEYIIYYNDYIDDTDYELALNKKAKYYDLRKGIQEISDYINFTLNILTELKIFNNNQQK